MKVQNLFKTLLLGALVCCLSIVPQTSLRALDLVGSYTIPADGVYSFVLTGAQGYNSGAYIGGNADQVTVSNHLYAGDIVSWNCYAQPTTQGVSGQASTLTVKKAIGGGLYTLATARGGYGDTPVYHTHTGDASAYGGCYTTPVYHVHTSACKQTVQVRCWCTNYVQGEFIGYHAYDGYPMWKCANCGHNSANHCPLVDKVIDVCGKTEGVTVESYVLGCGKTPGVTIDSYTRHSSNMGTSSAYSPRISASTMSEYSSGNGSLTIQTVLTDADSFYITSSNNSVYAQSVVLTAHYPASVGTPSWTTKTVTANGTYDCQFTYANGDVLSRSITVNNIDRVPPDLSVSVDMGSTPYDSFSDFYKGTGHINISASDEHAGVDASATVTYTDSLGNSNTCGLSGFDFSDSNVYTIKLADKAGNESTKTIATPSMDTQDPRVITIGYSSNTSTPSSSGISSQLGIPNDFGFTVNTLVNSNYSKLLPANRKTSPELQSVSFSITDSQGTRLSSSTDASVRTKDMLGSGIHNLKITSPTGINIAPRSTTREQFSYVTYDIYTFDTNENGVHNVSFNDAWGGSYTATFDVQSCGIMYFQDSLVNNIMFNGQRLNPQTFSGTYLDSLSGVMGK